MASQYHLEGESAEIVPVKRGWPLTLGINDRECVVERTSTRGSLQRYVIDGKPIEAHVARNGDEIYVQLDGEVWLTEAINAIDAVSSASAGQGSIIAPMPGVVVSVAVAIGDRVLAGQSLVVIESMKLQTSISAEYDGVIAEIFFTNDETFDKGAELMCFANPDESKEISS